MYRPIIESRKKILGSGGTSYPSYREPLVPLLCICSLWRPATSVKMNGYLRKLDRLFVWIFSIDRYLSWPYWTFISWDIVHLLEEGVFRIFFSIFKTSFLLSGQIDLEEIDSDKNDLGLDPYSSRNYGPTVVRIWTEKQRVDFFC